MDSTGGASRSETPIYDAVVAAEGWSPDDLRAPFDIDAIIAASYGTTKSSAPAGSAGGAP